MVTDATPVVLIGPASGYVGLDRTLVASLLARGRILVEIDISESQREGSVYAEELIEEIRLAISEASIERHYDAASPVPLPALVGYSLGAQAAALYAARQPGTISSLTLVSGWVETPDKMLELRSLIQSLRGRSRSPEPATDATVSRIIRLVLASTHGWASAAFGDRVREASHEMLALVTNCGAFDLQASVERIADPALVIGCSFDEFAGVTQSRKLFGALTDSRYAEIDAGHLVCAERPVELVALIEQFIEEPGCHSPGTRLDGYRP